MKYRKKEINGLIEPFNNYEIKLSNKYGVIIQ